VANGNRNTALSFFGRIVNHVIRCILGPATHREHFGDRSGQRRFAVVNVPDGSNIEMWFGSLKLLLCHKVFVPSKNYKYPGCSNQFRTADR
jgi:hypothetical protein